MDEAEQDQYEERLKEVFHSFDRSGSGSLCPQELSDLCQALHLEETAPALLHSFLNSQDGFIEKVDFEQFKDALILVLSTTVGEPLQSEDICQQPNSPEVNPKFVKGGKRYGRRSTPELVDSGFSGVPDIQPLKEDLEQEEEESSSVPRKRERWNVHSDSTEEYEAEGQLHFWNPDEPGTPHGAAVPLSDRLEERLREACEDLGLSLDGCANCHDLLKLCEHLCLEVKGDVFQGLDVDEMLNVQEFMSQVLRQSKPPTPSASTPYRQLKRHHSTQPFDETGRRTTTPSAMTSTIGLRLFSNLDDGTGYTHAEYILDAWLEEGIENSPEILKALDFCLDGKVNLGELTLALENELLVTKNGIHQAVLASFKAEIRHLLEWVDREVREKEKLRIDLEKAEKLKTQLATEVDEHHSAIERLNKLNIRKLEQDHKEKLAAVRAELTKEMNIIQQQANQQREEFDIEMENIKEELAFLREQLSLSAKENCRLEAEVLESTEKLVDAENQICKLQRNLDNIIKEKFGDLDIGSSEFFLQEERLRQLRTDYEEQYRELQDRIDELQTELEEYRSFNRVPNNFLKPSFSEFDGKSPGIESDQGLGSEEIQPFNMSLEAEMLVENLKAQHLREMEEVRDQLESKVIEYQQKVEEQRVAYEKQQSMLSLKCQEEVQSIQKMMSQLQDRVHELQNQLDQAEVLRVQLEQSQAEDHIKLVRRHEEEVSAVKQELLQSQTYAEELKNQLKTLELCQVRIEQSLKEEREELLKLQREEQIQLEEHHKEELEARLEEERARLQEERQEEERRLTDEWEREKSQLQAIHEELLQARLEEQCQIQKEAIEQERRLSEQWENEKSQLLEQQKVLLEEEKVRLSQEQEDVKRKLVDEWEKDRVQMNAQVEHLQARLQEEEDKLKEQYEAQGKLSQEWNTERAYLEQHYKSVLQTRLEEQRAKLLGEWEQKEKKLIEDLEIEKIQLEESHREAMQELSTKYSEERERLSGLLDKLRSDIAEERKELESHFSQRIKELEMRFSGDQEAVSERFQSDVSNLKQYYQSQLHDLSESHSKEKAKWQSEMEAVVQMAEKEKASLRSSLEQEKESVKQYLKSEQNQLEEKHKEELEALMILNQNLQNELERLVSNAQTKEIELSRQLNDLHNRFQENFDTKDQLLAQSEEKVLQMELLLRQAVEDFEQEKAELQDSLTELEEKNKETLALVEKHVEEKEQLQAEMNYLKSKILEREAEVNQLSHFKECSEKMSKKNEGACKTIALLQNQIKLIKVETGAIIKSQQVNLSDPLLQNIPEAKVGGDIASEDVRLISDLECMQQEKDENHDYDIASVQEKIRQLEKEAEMIPKFKKECELATKERDLCIQEIIELQEKVDCLRGQVCLFSEQKDQYDTTIEENLILQQQVSQLHLQNNELQLILKENKITRNEPNQPKNFKDKASAVIETVKETDFSEWQELQERYERCTCEKDLLKEQNHKLEKKVLSLESKMLDVKDKSIKFEDEMVRMKKENSRLTHQLQELQKQEDSFMILHQEADSPLTEATSEETFQDLNIQLEAKIQAVSDLEECCTEFERQNAKLRRALTDLQMKSCKIHEKMQVHRNEAGRLAEENFILRHKISALKEEDLQETHEEMLHKVDQFKKEKIAAEKMAENFKKQVSELHVLKQQLEAENEVLSQKNLQNAAGLQELNQQLSHLQGQHVKGELSVCQHEEEEDHLLQCTSTKLCSSKDLSTELANAVSRSEKLQEEKEALNEELSRCIEKVAKLGVVECQLSVLLQEHQAMERQTQGLRAQLAVAQDKVESMDEALQTISLQSARLKSDLRVTQQEKEALKQEMMSLHKQLQNVIDKNQVLEMALHTSGYQSQHKKLYWDEMACLVEQEQQLLKQENERLQRELQKTKEDLIRSQDKTRQLETTILSLKQQRPLGQSSLVRAIEQEKVSLKRELDSLHKEMVTASKRAVEHSETQRELETLQQENEGLKMRLARLETQLLEALQAQLRVQGERCGQHHGEDLGIHGPEVNLQEEQEIKMMKMEDRMRDVELKLRNVKLLLQEKVSQLKDQVHKNTKADIVIKDLYVENSQLLKALEMTEQQKKVAEKKNYLLEEKISSLNKIVRDLSPSPLTAVPYHFTRT